MNANATLMTILLVFLMTGLGCQQMADSEDTSAGSAPAAGSESAVTQDGRIDGRKLKRTAYLTIEVDDDDDVPSVIEATRALTGEYGGYVSSESSRSIEVMIPTEKLGEALSRVGETGEVGSKSISVQDVTAQYVDLEARIENLEEMRTRIQALLAKSGSMDDMLKAEKELNRVTTDLEQAKGQMRRMQRDTAYARLQVRVEKSVRPGPVGWVFFGVYKGVKWLFIWD
ncbi:MAG: DUF4349 domain-containing protein [Myxococcota bacterium]